MQMINVKGLMMSSMDPPKGLNVTSGDPFNMKMSKVEDASPKTRSSTGLDGQEVGPCL